MRRGLGLLVVASAAAVWTLGPAVPAGAATSPIQLGVIQYNPAGADNTKSNTSLNGEWVQIKNTGTRTVDLYHWTLRDAQAHVYTFASHVSLGAKRVVYVHTGAGANTTAHRYWGSRTFIWNNASDHAYLRNASGALADQCAWTDSYTGTAARAKAC